MTQANQLSVDSLFQFASGTEQILNLDLGNRAGQARLYKAEQFTVVESTFKPALQATVWRHHNQRPLVEMNFVLSGFLWQTHSGLLQQQAYVAGYHNCLFNPDSLEENELAEGKGFQMLSIQLEAQEMVRLLVEYAPELEVIAEPLAQQIPFMRQSPVLAYPEPIRHLLKTLWLSPGSPGLKRLYFDSVVLHLLSYVFNQLGQVKKSEERAGLKRGEKDKLYQARELLLSQLSKPPGLPQLAKACELNEFSLKRGFKQLFGITVYGFVLQQRMEAARIALYTGEKTVSEIAYELGYAHPQHFHRVFKRHYGSTPKAIKGD